MSRVSSRRTTLRWYDFPSYGDEIPLSRSACISTGWCHKKNYPPHSSSSPTHPGSHSLILTIFSMGTSNPLFISAPYSPSTKISTSTWLFSTTCFLHSTPCCLLYSTTTNCLYFLITPCYLLSTRCLHLLSTTFYPLSY